MIRSLPAEQFPWPFDRAAWHMAMGLRPLEPGRWLTVDERLPVLLAERRRLLDEHPLAVTGLVPGAEAAAREAAQALLDEAVRVWPALYQRMTGAGAVRGPDGTMADPAGPGNPLAAIGRILADDVCLLQNQGGQWRLTAAVLCFPNRWRLGEKLGRSLAGVHQPVPLYAGRLAGPVDRFFDTLQPGRGVWRTNWSLADDPALFQPDETAHQAPLEDITTANAGHRLFLRVERQTLMKLPGSGAVIFNIGTHQRSLAALDRTQAADFAAVLRSVPAEVARYKGLHRTGALALSALDP